MATARRVDKGDRIIWYDSNNKKLREDTIDGTTFYNTSATKVAEFTNEKAAVYLDTSNYVKFTSAEIKLNTSGSGDTFVVSNTGKIVGKNATYSYTLDPASLNANATFQATDVCPEQTMRTLRTTPS